MYIIGIFKSDTPRVLINPKTCRTPQELFQWLLAFMSKDPFILSEPFAFETLTEALKQDKPIRVNIDGYAVSILLGADEIIQNVIRRFVHLKALDVLTATAEEVQETVLKEME